MAATDAASLLKPSVSVAKAISVPKMTRYLAKGAEELRTPEEEAEQDRQKTGRWRCIGCSRFLKDDANWNQCPECDTRYPEEM